MQSLSVHAVLVLELVVVHVLALSIEEGELVQHVLELLATRKALDLCAEREELLEREVVALLKRREHLLCVRGESEREREKDDDERNETRERERVCVSMRK